MLEKLKKLQFNGRYRVETGTREETGCSGLAIRTVMDRFIVIKNPNEEERKAYQGDEFVKISFNQTVEFTTIGEEYKNNELYFKITETNKLNN